MQERVDEFPQWTVTIAFYAALHVVEAVFALEHRHSEDHGQRHRYLKTQSRYQHIHDSYLPLWNDSLLARYLECDARPKVTGSFSQYMPPAKVVEVHVNHNLHQIIESARRLIGDPNFLK